MRHSDVVLGQQGDVLVVEPHGVRRQDPSVQDPFGGQQRGALLP